MTIELLPPTIKKQTGKYHVVSNYCGCHPETCCCNDWVLNDKKGERVTTFFNKSDAQETAEKLNANEPSADT